MMAENPKREGGDLMAQVAAEFELTVSDTSQQKIVSVEGVSAQASVGDIVQKFLDELNLPRNDAHGQSLSYQALLNREARHLRADERVGDALINGDWLTLHPDVDAG
jgi:hypothetical protein